MPLARFHHLTFEVLDLEQAGDFWATALDYTREPGTDPRRLQLRGNGPHAQVELVQVDSARIGPRRVHLDIHAPSIDELLAAGAHVLDEEARPWVVLHCPEHRELGVLLTDQPHTERPYQLVMDSPEPEAAAAWWGRVLATTVRPVAEDPDVAFIEPVPHAPFESIVFARESQPKTEPNSSWMTLTSYDSAPLVLAGATLLERRAGGTTRMADPDGNEFDVITLGH